MPDIREQEMQQTIDSLSAVNEQLTTENAQLKQRVAVLQKHLYGRQSEKKTVLYPDGQMSLFDEAETEAKRNAPEPVLTVKEHKRKKKTVGHREEMLAALPHKKVLVQPAENEKICPNCGHELSSLGEECIRSEVVHIPARIEVIDYYCQSFECRHCRKEGRSTIVKPVMPQPVIPHSIASASVVAHSMIQKYLYAMPLYRQEQEWRQLGLSVSRANLSNWILLAAQEWLYPLLDRMHEELLHEPCIHADETPIQVMQEAGRKNTTKSYMWLYTSGPFEAHRTIRIFEYQPTRHGDHAKAFLNGFHGYLLTDAFAGYEKADRSTHCLCWSHARRKFVDAKPANMTDITGTLVKEGIDRISHLFHLESDYAACSAAERKQKRLDEEKPCLEALLAWAETNKEKVLPKSPLSKALYYLLSNWDGLTRYLEDGRCSLSNNIAENSIRPFTVGRKNWLFSGSPKGAKASAAVYSIIETCKANQLNPENYLLYLFQHLPNETKFPDRDVLDRYMPWNPEIRTACEK